MTGDCLLVGLVVANAVAPGIWTGIGPSIVCCASGTRSAMAAHRLRRLGFGRVVNAGSWRSLR